MSIGRVLISGGSGYQARFIIERLREKYELTILDRVKPGGGCSDLAFVEGDVTKYDDVRRACEGQDAVVHLIALVRERGGKTASDFADIMVKGTWHVAQACVEQGVKRLVNISSIIAIGMLNAEDMPYASDAPCKFAEGDFYYCLAKHLGEDIAKAYHQAHGLEVFNLRPGVIAGDGVNQGPQVPESPKDHWFIYVDPRDVAQGVEAALTSSAAQGCYNLVAGRADSGDEWQNAVGEIGYDPQHNWPEIPEKGGKE